MARSRGPRRKLTPEEVAARKRDAERLEAQSRAESVQRATEVERMTANLRHHAGAYCAAACDDVCAKCGKKAFCYWVDYHKARPSAEFSSMQCDKGHYLCSKCEDDASEHCKPICPVEGCDGNLGCRVKKTWEPWLANKKANTDVVPAGPAAKRQKTSSTP